MRSIRAATSGRLERNALALMVGTVTTALVGLLFWTAATHFYTTAEVGRASAVLAAAAFLGNLAHLNIGNVYARFLPAAGQRTRSLVRWGLLLTGALGIVLGTGFALLWPSGSLFASGAERALFPLAVGILAVFTVQDSVLLGVGAARWIPVENLAFSVAKLVLLVVLAGVLPRGGLVAAWVAPALVAVVVIVSLLHRTFMPRHMGREDLLESLPRPSALAGYAAGELTTGLMIYIVPMVLPLIIVARLGNEANAYFAIPEVISSALTMLTWNIAVSFVVEAAADERRARALARRSLGIALVVSCAGAATLLAGAPLILSIFGPAYADQGTTLLRLLALTAPATVVTVVYTSVLRIHRKVSRVVAIQVALCGIVLTLVSLLIDGLGIVGVGIAYLCAEGGVAVVVLVPLLRSLREPGTPSAGSALQVARPREPPTPDGPPVSGYPGIPSPVAPQVSAPGRPVTPP
jgi:O-antigen/teichoic acid export membrane protein